MGSTSPRRRSRSRSTGRRASPPPRRRSRSPDRRRSRSRSRGRGGGYARRSPPRGGNPGNTRDNDGRISLVVRNIGERVDVGDLRHAFEKYGMVKE